MPDQLVKDLTDQCILSIRLIDSQPITYLGTYVMTPGGKVVKEWKTDNPVTDFNHASEYAATHYLTTLYAESVIYFLAAGGGTVGLSCFMTLPGARMILVAGHGAFAYAISD